MFYQTIIHLVTVINALQDIDLTSFATFLSIGGLFLLSSHIQLNPSHVIFAMAFCSRINSSVGYHVSQAIKKLFQFKVSVRRLEKFLLLSDGYTTNLNHIKRNKERCEDHEVKIKVSNLSFSMGDQFSLANLNFESKTGGGELIVVEGESGSGKVFFAFFVLGLVELF
jgi:ABC-type bacteriocin/lantibiotic exporter with double-glycine peptidase domain